MPKLSGIRVLVTAGPTRERIDPVRFISNYSSGKQGYAIASVFAEYGASVHLVTGPTCLPYPENVLVTAVESARDMLAACEALMPVDIAICAAAVADYRPEAQAKQKIKKNSKDSLTLQLIANPDILLCLGKHPRHRPRLVIGFAAETENIEHNAKIKLNAKACDWIIANNVSENKVFGSDHNSIYIISKAKSEYIEQLSKIEIARLLAARAADYLKNI